MCTCSSHDVKFCRRRTPWLELHTLDGYVLFVLVMYSHSSFVCLQLQHSESLSKERQRVVDAEQRISTVSRVGASSTVTMCVFSSSAAGRQSHQCPTITAASRCSACSLVVTFVLVSVPLSFLILFELVM